MWNYSTIFKMCFGILSVVLMWGCDSHEEKASYGLDVVVEMELTSEEMTILNSGTYSKTPVNIPLWINGEEFIGRVSCAGATQVDALKRSFEIHLPSSFKGRTVYRLSAMNGDLSALRAMTVFHAFSKMGFKVPEVTPAALWINDDYAGLYLLMSRYDETYFKNQNTVAAQLYQAENGVGDFKMGTSLKRGFSVKLGPEGKADLSKVTQLVAAAPTEANCNALEKAVDLDNALTYMAMSALLDNRDGIVNNYFLLRTVQDSRFQVVPWDLDLTIWNHHDVNDGRLFAQNALFMRLFSGESCGHLYADAYVRAKEQLKNLNLKEFTEDYAAFIREAFEADWFLSGDERTLDNHVDEISTFLDTALDTAVQ